MVEDMALLPPGQLRLHMAQEMEAAAGELRPDSFTYYVMLRWRAAGV